MATKLPVDLNIRTFGLRNGPAPPTAIKTAITQKQPPDRRLILKRMHRHTPQP
jgi:hypothetical protein